MPSPTCDRTHSVWRCICVSQTHCEPECSSGRYCECGRASLCEGAYLNICKQQKRNIISEKKCISSINITNKGNIVDYNVLHNIRDH